MLRTSLKLTVIALCISSSALFAVYSVTRSCWSAASRLAQASCLVQVLALALGPAAVPHVRDGLGFGALVCICALAGLLRGGTDPLFFELAAELCYPAPAGAAGGVLTFVYHLVLVACLSLPPSAMAWSMVAMSAALLVSAATLAPVRVRYARR
jgi:hypothetical protein